MIIKKQILGQIRTNFELRSELAYQLRVSDQAIRRYISLNKPDGELTKYKALLIISKHLNVPIGDLQQDEKMHPYV